MVNFYNRTEAMVTTLHPQWILWTYGHWTDQAPATLNGSHAQPFQTILRQSLSNLQHETDYSQHQEMFLGIVPNI